MKCDCHEKHHYRQWATYWRNNANYTAITTYKVIQGHQFWYHRKPICNFLLVIKGYLNPEKYTI